MTISIWAVRKHRELGSMYFRERWQDWHAVVQSPWVSNDVGRKVWYTLTKMCITDSCIEVIFTHGSIQIVSRSKFQHTSISDLFAVGSRESFPILEYFLRNLSKTPEQFMAQRMWLITSSPWTLQDLQLPTGPALLLLAATGSEGQPGFRRTSSQISKLYSGKYSASMLTFIIRIGLIRFGISLAVILQVAAGPIWILASSILSQWLNCLGYWARKIWNLCSPWLISGLVMVASLLMQLSVPARSQFYSRTNKRTSCIG